VDVTGSLSDLLAAALDEGDESRRWDLVLELHHRETPETYEAARALVASPDPNRRRLGADVPARMGAFVGRTTARRYRLAAVAVLLPALEVETDIDALDAMVVALGLLGDPRAVAPVARLRWHGDADIRFAVAFSLGGFSDPGAVDALIELSGDSVPRVRDWATFGLGREELLAGSDAPRVREGLAARLDDPDEHTRFEAAMGLALAGDPRAVDPVLEMMSTRIRRRLWRRPS
jgi:HEAT repeat protein